MTSFDDSLSENKHEEDPEKIKDEELFVLNMTKNDSFLIRDST